MVIIMDIINIGDMKRGEIMDLNEDKIDLTQYFNRFYISLRKLKKWLLLLIVVCFLFMEIRTMFFFETTYSSRAVFIAYQSEQTNIFSQSDDNDDLVTTFNRLLTGNMMQEIICQELNVSSVPGQISLSRLTDTNLINLTVTAADPQDAYDVINCIVNNYGQVTEIVMSDVSLSLLDTPQLATSPDAYPDYIKSGKKWQKVKENPEDEYSRELLKSLGNLGKRMLSTEESLVVSYGSPDEAINLMDRISDKKQTLTTSLEETTMGKGHK